jgi:hypothetical protein
MKKFQQLTQAEKISILQTAAGSSEKSETIFEKDFWVCWTLDKLFSITEIKDHLTFKGGTSLSKVYGVIERFSEDIDISIEKNYLGFSGDKDPEKFGSKKRNEILKELSESCQKFIKSKLLPELHKLFAPEIPDQTWKIEIDPNDPDEQTILFYYPESTPSKSGYIRPSVKIEFGARSEHWPVGQQKIQSYLKSALPDLIDENEIEIKVLNIERTFREKATILHMYAHFPDGKSVPVRQSRHYYDFYCLLESKFKNESEKLIDLLIRVAEHKSIYFRAGWASYETAKKGTLKLLPPQRILLEMEDDYEKMSEMFFNEQPSWTQIIEAIGDFEKEFNNLD